MRLAGVRGGHLLLLCVPTSGALLGTTWRVSLDIGQEKGTWMPPRWGASGVRALATPVLSFQAEGRLVLEDSGPWDHLTVQWCTADDGSIGRWMVDDNSKATFFLEHEGLERKDVRLEPGKLYCTAGAWGDVLARRGGLTIKQKKFGWMPFLPTANEASFIVGVFRAARLDTPDGDAEAESETQIGSL